jgi:hypothetical protein
MLPYWRTFEGIQKGSGDHSAERRCQDLGRDGRVAAHCVRYVLLFLLLLLLLL